MSQSQTFNNTVYQIPVQGDTKWAPPLTRYLAALGTYAISPAGGTYTLTADLNLGPTFGLLTAYYKSASSNIAATGIVRLAQADTVSWRNVANSADLALAVNGSNQLTFNGSTLNTLAIPVTVPNGGTGLTSTTINGVLIGGATTTGALQNVGTGSINQVLTSAGAGLAPVWSAIGTGTVNTGTQYQLAYYSTSSNIVSGLTLLTGNKALASDVNGLPVASATTDTELGYVSGVTSAIQTQLNGKLSLTGGTMSGAIAMGSNKITGLTNGSASSDAAAFGQIASALTSYLPLSGGTMTGAVAMGSHGITGLPAASSTGDALSKGNPISGTTGAFVGQITQTDTTDSALIVQTVGSTLSSGYKLLQGTNSGSGNVNSIIMAKQTSISNSAFTNIIVGGSSGFYQVWGFDGTNGFSDIVNCTFLTFSVINSLSQGSPPARTYQMTNGTLQLKMASGTTMNTYIMGFRIDQG